MKSIGLKSIGTGKKVLINTNTTNSKSIENNQYKYFLKVLKIPIVLMVKGLDMYLEDMSHIFVPDIALISRKTDFNRTEYICVFE